MNIKYNIAKNQKGGGRVGQKLLLAFIAGVLPLTLAAAPAADAVTQAVDAATQGARADKASQQRINALDDATRQLLDRYRTALWQSQQLTVYAQQLDQLAQAQDGEKTSLERQLTEIDRTERELLPLMLRMVDTLEKFTGEDLPFLKQERTERVAALKRLMADPEAGIAEKYRRILEAYQIEADYGRSLGAERAEVSGRVVDVLRIGRTGLYYLGMDGSAGYWDAINSKWLPLDRKHLNGLRLGLKIARETAAADLLSLPVPIAAPAVAEVVP